jgi:hypothetical protein
MLHARIATALAVVFVAGTALWAQQDKSKQIDPPKQMEGLVKTTDNRDPRVLYVTITVKEQQPTAEEDMFREVDKDHRFRVNADTKIIGLDGKPDKRGLKSLDTGSRVEVTYEGELALEVKVLPPK